MERLADLLDWRVRSSGSAWTVQEPKTFYGLKYSNLSLLCVMARVALHDHQLTPEDIREATMFRPRHFFDLKRRRWDLDLPAKTNGTDEATMYRVFFDPEEETS